MATFETEIESYLEWMRVHNYASTTIENRKRYLGYFATFAQALGAREPKEVTRQLVAAYQRKLHSYRKANGCPLSVATQVQRLVPVSQFFTWLRQDHGIEQDPTRDLLMPRPNRQLPEATLSALEMARLMSVPDVTRPLGLRDRAVLEVFYSSALRRSEVIALRVPDLDFERGTLFIRRGKGAKDRFVPIGERALFWIRLYLGIVRPQFCVNTPSDVLFVSSVGTPMCADWLCRKVHAYLSRAGIHKRGSCHLLRHSVATLMLEGGADIRYVAEMLGHARLETTQRYTRVSIDRLRSVHARCHPAAGLDVAMATELCSILPAGRGLVDMPSRHRE
jgi:integrase/recombinase XerD